MNLLYELPIDGLLHRYAREEAVFARAKPLSKIGTFAMDLTSPDVAKPKHVVSFSALASHLRSETTEGCHQHPQLF